MEWGTAAEWVTALLTGGGLFAAVRQLRLNLVDAQAARERASIEERERREAMARAVGVKVSWQSGPDGGPPDPATGLIPCAVEIVNGSPYPISGARLDLAGDEYPSEIVLGTILPGEHLKETYEVPRREVVFGELLGGAALRFTDTYGLHWIREPHDLRASELPARIC